MNIIPWFIAIAVEIILLCLMQETVWLGIMIFTVGLMLHGWFLHGNVRKRRKRKYIFMETYCFLWGACMIGLYLADRFLKELDGYEKQEYVVYINSKDPQNFVLRRGGDKGAFLIILIGIALICALF